ncbi:MAG: hypothetical protein AAGA93_18280 [Actinomycetota bacterium]
MGEPQVFHLHQRSLLRIWLATQVVFQLAFYLAFAGMVLTGDGGYMAIGVLGIAGVFGFSMLRSHLLLQPPLRVDLDERTIEARSGSLARSRLPFDVAETMELRTGFLHQLYLSPTETDGERGDRSRRRRFRLNLTRGGRRADDGRHQLAHLLPTPLGQLSDGVYAAEPPTWGDAARVACFVGVPRAWVAQPTAVESS